jgi:hypothetical protein
MVRAILAAALASVALVGCGGGGAKDAAEELASFKVSLNSQDLFGNFAGNSVWICGTRDGDADSKYPCDNSFCRCFDFNADGTLTAEVENLCPSKNVPEGTWDFTYTIYSEPGCSETVDNEILNDGYHNFVCYDSGDFENFSHENMTADEYLAPGCNENEITCLTRNAKKIFDFDVCVLVEETCLPDTNGQVPDACTWTCGNGICDRWEWLWCPQDCPPPPTCGDHVCNGDETCETCACDCGECPNYCGDGTCDEDESCLTCPGDCGTCFQLDCGCYLAVEPVTNSIPVPEPECICPPTFEPPTGCWLDEETCYVVCPGDAPAIDQPAP